MSEARIKARVAGRNAADVLSDVAFDEIKEHPNHGADFAEAMIERFGELMPKRADHQPVVPKLEPISRLGQTIIRFGSHCGKKFDNIPVEYLDWLCGQQEELIKELRAYLKHPELQEHRR